jgi:hypothetical protein
MQSPEAKLKLATKIQQLVQAVYFSVEELSVVLENDSEGDLNKLSARNKALRELLDGTHKAVGGIRRLVKFLT